MTARSGGVSSGADGGGRRVDFRIPVPKGVANFLPSGCGKEHAVDCRGICAVAAVIGYRQAAELIQWTLAEGSGFLFPSVLEGGEKGELALTPAQMTTSLPTHLRAVIPWRISGTRCTPSEWEGQ